MAYLDTDAPPTVVEAATVPEHTDQNQEGVPTESWGAEWSSKEYDDNSTGWGQDSWDKGSKRSWRNASANWSTWSGSSSSAGPQPKRCTWGLVTNEMF